MLSFENKVGMQYQAFPGIRPGGFVSVLLIAACLMACNTGGLPDRPKGGVTPIDNGGIDDDDNGPVLPNIDLTTWKVTLPLPREDGKPLEVYPPEILDYANNNTLKPFMYNDSTDGAIVFYTYPGSTTANTSYSRTELREIMDGFSNNTNWTFEQGGYLKGTLAVPEISTDQNGKPHRVIVMQIHGRLTDQQKNLIGASDNNAPPVLKIYWQDGKVRVKTKVLKDLNATYEQLLQTDAWEDDAGRTFSRVVGTDKFTLEVKVSAGRMEVTMDGEETFVYDDIHMQKWAPFENYFKAGNYLVTTDEGAFAKVKYYELEVNHD